MGCEMNAPNMMSVCECAVEVRPWPGLGQIQAHAAYYVRAVEDLCYAQRSIGQSVWQQLPLGCGQM